MNARSSAAALCLLCLLGLFVALSGCNTKPSEPSPIEQATVYFNGIEQLRDLKLTENEVAQLALARQAGLSDQSCVDLMDIARRRGQPFSDGQAIAGLRRAGFSESSVMTLARLNQLSGFAGEAQIMRLAGLSDEVILAIARRRNAGQPVLSSAKAAQLRNVQLTNPQILQAVNRGTTDAQADAIIAQRTRAAKTFIRQRGTRRR